MLTSLFGIQSYANNLVVSSFSLTGQNTASDFTMAQFTLGWENSWRDNVNYDAAWIFVKYRVPGGSGGDNNWRHATLSNIASQHTAPTGAEIKPTTDGKGVFLYRSSNGGGNVNYANVQIRWNYGGDLKSNVVGNFVGDNDQIEIQVFAIEMVYVPQGAFYLGDGTTTNIQGQFEAANTGAPFLVTSENAITLGGAGAGSLGNHNNVGTNNPDDFNYSTTKLLPTSFPKGFNAYFSMKYETTQKQYVDFLNNITPSQAAIHEPTNFGQNGQGIFNSYPYSTNQECLPVIWINPRSAAAYWDWACLRPMTEFEFEKSCRGTQIPVKEEFAWGAELSSMVTATALSTETGCNQVVTSLGSNISINNKNRSGLQRPLRVGIFATANSTRIQSGASFYGIMELSGNVWDAVVSVSQSVNRTFLGSHGDGLLNTSGYANNSDWPGFDGSKIVNYNSGFRGASWYQSSADDPNYYKYGEVSNRIAATDGTLVPDFSNGFRGVRTAP